MFKVDLVVTKKLSYIMATRKKGDKILSYQNLTEAEKRIVKKMLKKAINKL